MHYDKKMIFKNWYGANDGLAAMEFALVFPILMMLLMGVFDFGSAFLVNQKAITASEVMADLVSRNISLTQSQIDDVVEAGKMAIAPYSTSTFGYDIVSIEFDDDAIPDVCWRETSDNILPDEDLVNDTEALGAPGEGIVVVSVTYTYEPHFASRLMGQLGMKELAFTRGRRVPIVSFKDDAGIVGCVE